MKTKYQKKKYNSKINLYLKAMNLREEIYYLTFLAIYVWLSFEIAQLGKST